jgi:SAM-dependent methyltransferase
MVKTDAGTGLAAAYRVQNQRFFDEAPARWLETLAGVKGLDTDVDLELLYPHVADLLKERSHVVLELGFGYGRVLRWLRRKSPGKRIVAIDHSRSFYLRLRRQFRQDPKVELIHGCILDCPLKRPINVALWLWAGICELDAADKLKALGRIAAVMANGGRLAVEFPDEIVGHRSVEYRGGGYLRLKTKFGVLNVFRATAKELEQIAKAAGFRLIDNLPYRTTCGIARRLLILAKKQASHPAAMRNIAK